MEEEHKHVIQSNYKTLVEKVNLSELLPRLIEKKVFLPEQYESYRNPQKTDRERKRQLFFDILRRGPEAFGKLISSLKECGGENKRLAHILLGEKNPEIENNNYKKDDETECQNRENKEEGAHPFMLPADQRPPHIRQLSLEIPNANINLSSVPLQVRVKKSERFYDNSNETKIPVYTMRSKNRGIFLCINNIEFANNVHDRRNGAEADEKSLKDLFKQMGFQFQGHRNQSYRDMIQTIEKFADSESLKAVDCVVIAIMSHGVEGETKENSFIITSDGRRIPVSWLIEQFNNINCPYMIYKPKIFFFQICRGNNPHVGVRVDRSLIQSRVQSDGYTIDHIVRDQEDMLIAFSTLPGDKSYRDTELGTWYMQSICKVFMQHAHDTDVQNMLILVDDQLRKLKSAEGNMQTSPFENRGFKLCYFNPGIYEDDKKIRHFSNSVNVET